MANEADKDDSGQYRLRQKEKSSWIEMLDDSDAESERDRSNPLHGDSNMKGKSPVSTTFMIIGIVVFLMAFKVAEWGETLYQNPLAIIAIFGTLGLLGLGGIIFLVAAFFKTYFGLTTDEDHRTGAQNNPRRTRRFFKWFFVIVQLGVLGFFITFAIQQDYLFLLFVLVIAAGALIWRAWKWDRIENKTHGTENALQRHLRAQAKRRRR